MIKFSLTTTNTIRDKQQNMERFAKIKAVRSKILNFDSVCRCCGMVNDERCLILEQNDDDVPLKEKIRYNI